MEPLTLYLLRHGESELNSQRVFAGPSTDPALTTSGAQQAKLQAASLKNIPFSAIYSSPLLRAKQTAHIMKGDRDMEIRISDQLQEVDIGFLDGQSIDIPENLATYRQVVAQWERDIQSAGFPGGERLVDVKERFHAFLESLPTGNTNSPILVIGHGILFMAVLWLFSKQRLDRIQDYYLGRCHRTIAAWDGTQLIVEGLNIPPLPGVESESALR